MKTLGSNLWVPEPKVCFSGGLAGLKTIQQTSTKLTLLLSLCHKHSKTLFRFEISLILFELQAVDYNHKSVQMEDRNFRKTAKQYDNEAPRQQLAVAENFDPPFCTLLRIHVSANISGNFISNEMKIGL